MFGTDIAAASSIPRRSLKRWWGALARREVRASLNWVSEIDRLLAQCREAAAHVVGECPWCGRPLPAGRRRWCSDSCRADFVDNHFWGHARERALKRDDRTCQHCGKQAPKLEVNHIEPRRGQGYRAGCHHHVDLLETLCRTCHVAVTHSQRLEYAAEVR
ncbi:MAG: hypothetical protein JWL76_471 [Thermoleophilia bacterium]|nr:hypothetical protein [Thermoleophilia bacterium]